jgi:transcriptional regulator with XRE-family HTH domain
LAKLLGRSQATVSNVERGERRLDVIELRDWLAALEFDFIAFVSDLDAELRRAALPLHRHNVTGAGRSAIHALGGLLRAPK